MFHAREQGYRQGAPVLFEVSELVQVDWQDTEIHPDFIQYAHQASELSVHHLVRMKRVNIIVNVHALCDNR